VLIGEDYAYLPLYGGEAVRRDGQVIGRLRSVGYGTTVARTIAYVYLPSGLEEGSQLQVDAFSEQIPAVVAASVLVDPRGDRMRG
jgi:4-methylaminobutanoate oxidase (formaldehyde-forming)